MKKLIYWSLKNKYLVLGLLIVFISVGSWVATTVPIDAVPDITNTQVMINVKTGALGPEQIERQVTVPMEREITGIPGVVETRSLSKYGLSQIIIVFENAVDIYWARTQVLERLNTVELPLGIKPELAPITTGLGEIVMYTVEADPFGPLGKLKEMDKLIRLREIQDRLIKTELKRVPGVADVDTNGGYRKQIHINVFPERLTANGLSFLAFKKLVENMGQNVGGGYIQENGNQIIVSVSNELQTIDDVAAFPLKINYNGKQLNISDVAEVRVESGLRVGAATHRGQETVLGTVLMRSGANSREVAKESVAKLKSISLPEGVHINIQYARSYLVDATISTVSRSLVEGAALVIVILILLIGDLRSSLVVAAVIPISLIGAFVGMKLTGVSANLMSLGALDFGLIVDGAVVLVENIVRRSGNKKYLEGGRINFFLAATTEVIKPIVFGVSIIMLVYAPILFLSGTEGKMFRPMALTVLYALVASLILTIIFVPVISLAVLKIDEQHKSPWIFQRLEALYNKLLIAVFPKKKTVLGITLTLLGLSLWVLNSQLGSDFIPQLDEGDLVIGLVREASQGIDESIKQQKEAELRIQKFSEVEAVFSRMGTPDSATDPMSVNFADTFVILKKDKNFWRDNPKTGEKITKDQLFEIIKDDLIKHLPKQDISQTQPIEMRFNEILEGSRADVTLRFYGPDLNILSKLISESQLALAGVPGLFDSQLDSLTALTKSQVMEVKPIDSKMAAYRVNYNDLKNSFSLALAGEQVGVVYEYDMTIPLILHLDESLRESEQKIARLPIDTIDQGIVPLSEISQLKRTERVTTIARSWGQRYSALSLFVKGRDLGTFVKEAQQIIDQKIKLPKGYKLSWGGQFRNMAEARSRFIILIPTMFLIIFFLLYQNFGYLREAFLVFSVIPLAVIGGVFSLWLRGMSLTVPAIIGFIALVGIAVLNGVVLITFISELKRGGLDSASAIIRGAGIRLRPVLMTALVAGLGFLPMALNTGIGAEVQKPLATVVIGGLISATFLTLIFIPVVYDWITNE